MNSHRLLRQFRGWKKTRRAAILGAFTMKQPNRHSAPHLRFAVRSTALHG
jgi:hypothetical protein